MDACVAGLTNSESVNDASFGYYTGSGYAAKLCALGSSSVFRPVDAPLSVDIRRDRFLFQNGT